MNVYKKVLIAGALLTLTACGSYGLVVKKEAAAEKKRIAIYSIHSNRVIYNKDGGGRLTGLMSLAKSLSKSDKATAGPNNLLKYSYDSYVTALKKVNGWQVMPRESLTKMSAYKNTVSNMTKRQKTVLFSADHYGAEGINYHNYRLGTSGDFKDDINKICDELGVDAIAYVGMNFAYEAANAFGGMGSASADVATRIVLVNKNGEKIVDTQYGITKGLGLRHQSDSKTALIAGNIILNAKTEAVYKEAIDKATTDILNKINEGIKGEK